MKKILRKTTAAFLILSVCAALLYSCGAEEKHTAAEVSLLTKAMNVSVSGTSLDLSSLEAQMGAFSGKKGTSLEILFAEAVAVNTVVLNEQTDHVVRGYTVEVEQNGDYTPVCKQDIVGQTRYCTFDTISTKAIRVTVTDTADSKTFHISSTSVYDRKNDPRDFTVTAYAVGADIYNAAYLNAGALAAVSDVVIYGLTSFDASGKIVYNDITVNGKTVGGKAALEQALGNIRAAQKANKHNVRILCSLIVALPAGTSGDDDALTAARGNALVSAVNDNGDALNANVLALIKEYKLDGVDFYYDYPHEEKYADALSDWISALSEQSGDSLLYAALPAACVSLKSAAKKALSRVEIMAYDSFDAFGSHSPFEGCCVAVIDAYEKAGYDKERLSLGIPFFGRPTDGGESLYSYSLEAKKLGRYKNFVTGAAPVKADACQTRGYNSRQMVYDKTSYAFDYGLGGVMAWHLGCDVAYGDKLSLFSAIHSCIASRTGSASQTSGKSA